MLDEAGQDLTTGLKRRRERPAERTQRLGDMIAALDEAIATIDRGNDMTDNDVESVFGGFEPSQYEEEVRERWGDTDSYAESRRRTTSYTEDDWRRQRKESDNNVSVFVDLVKSGVPATGPEAVEAAREHGAIIDRWFYPLGPQAHLGLARMYVTDPRFEATYEKAATGLAHYISDAIVALHSD